jgi:hypothetical protein
MVRYYYIVRIQEAKEVPSSGPPQSKYENAKASMPIPGTSIPSSSSVSLVSTITVALIA